MEYVKSKEYADKDALRADSDATNFSIPGLGLLNFSKTGYMIFNVCVFLVFLLVFALEGVRGRIKAGKVFRNSCIALGSALGFLVLGELVAFICGKIAGVQFKPFGIMQGIMFDNAAMIVSVVLMTVVTIAVYWAGRSKLSALRLAQ